jgi:hypothetical protein
VNIWPELKKRTVVQEKGLFFVMRSKSHCIRDTIFLTSVQIEQPFVPNFMILCPVCNTENDQYATICLKCGAFLQNRVPNLDLFATSWQLVENPKKAFQLIALAEHKNYSILLYAIFGISLCMTGFWYFRLGDRFESLITLTIWALVIGIPLGILACPITTLLHWIYCRILGGRASFRTSLGITGYSLTPIVASLFLVLPVELSTFGMYLFTFNPHPMTIKPVSYVLLIGFDAAVSLWTLILVAIGTKIGHQMSIVKSIIVVCVLFATVLGGLLYGANVILRMI